MSAGLEPEAAVEFLVARLNADAQIVAAVPGGWHRGQAPASTPFPNGTINMLSGLPLLTAEGTRVYMTLVYGLRLVVKNQPASSAKTARNRMVLVLHKTSGATADGTVFSCTVEDAIEYQEVIENDYYWHLGHKVRLYIQ